MKYIVVSNNNDKQIMYQTSTGINCIGLALDRDGNDIEYHSIYQDFSVILSSKPDIAIVSINDVSRCHRLVKLLQMCGIKIVGYADGVSRKLEFLGLDLCGKYLDILSMIDFVLVNNFDNAEYLELFMDNAKILNIGMPINREFVLTSYHNSPHEREEGLVWQGYISEYRVHHNTLMQLAITQNLGLGSLLVTEQAGNAKVLQAKLFDMGFYRATVYEPIAPKDFLALYLARCSMAMYCPQRASLGRTAAECAVIGIPCIGTGSYFQEKLFPGLMFKEVFNLATITESIINGYDYKAKETDMYHPENWYNTFVEAIGQ